MSGIKYPSYSNLSENNGLFLTESEKEWIKDNPVIVLSVDETYPPRNFKDKKGTLSGISIDYMRLIEKKLGVKIRFEGSLWHAALKKAMTHKVDGVINADLLEERKPYLNFTDVLRSDWGWNNSMFG